MWVIVSHFTFTVSRSVTQILEFDTPEEQQQFFYFFYINYLYYCKQMALRMLNSDRTAVQFVKHSL
jgi:hypothetical protein